jgi:hypothetical protein
MCVVFLEHCPTSPGICLQTATCLCRTIADWRKERKYAPSTVTSHAQQTTPKFPKYCDGILACTLPRIRTHEHSADIKCNLLYASTYMKRACWPFGAQSLILKILRSAHTVYLYVLCGSENKQRLFHCTALTDWFL